MNRLGKYLLVPPAFVIGLMAGGVFADQKYIGRCDIRFDCSSTLHDFSGSISNVSLAVFCRTNAAGEPRLDTCIEIGPRQLTTHNSKRDLNMYKMFQVDRFPKLLVIVTNASLADAKLSPANPPSGPGKIPGRFVFCGVTNEIPSATSRPQLVATGWEFELETIISLKAFNLKPDRALFGAITVGDLVKVKTHVKLQKEPP
jgi:hypothetical protein